jgi:hypothetical protein
MHEASALLFRAADPGGMGSVDAPASGPSSAAVWGLGLVMGAVRGYIGGKGILRGLLAAGKLKPSANRRLMSEPFLRQDELKLRPSKNASLLQGLKPVLFLRLFVAAEGRHLLKRKATAPATVRGRYMESIPTA